MSGISVTNTKSPITVVDDKVTIKVTSGIGPQGPAGADGSGGGGGAGVSSLNGLTGTVTIVAGGGVTASGSSVTIGGVATTDSRLSDSREWTASTVSQAAAEAGADTTRVAWTVLRVWQAIAAWWAASAAKTKLDGIATGATANQADAYLLARANHTGTQAWSTIVSTPTTLSGYGITDAATATHVHGNITNAGAIGSTSGLPIITTTSGVLTVGSFGSSSGQFCQGNDSRLSDARTPTSHVHGNITNAGAIGSTSGLPIITTTSGVLTVGAFGSSAGQFCVGDDSRLSDARTPTSHIHGNITNAGAIGSTSGLVVVTTASGVLTTAATISAATQVSGLATIATSGSASDLGSGTVPVARLGSSGTASSSTYLRGDNTWATVSGGISDGNKGDVTVSASGATWTINSGAIVAADINPAAFATLSQARDSGNESVLMSPARVRTMLQFSRKLELTTTAVQNGGVASQYGDVRLIGTGTGAQGHGSYALAGPGDSYQFISQSASATNIDWSKPHWIAIRVWRGTGSTNGIFRFLLGATATGAPGATPNIRTLTGAGIGFSIVGRRLFIVCHNGSALTNFDTGFDTEADSQRPMDFLLYTNGANTTDGIGTAGTVTLTYSTQATGPTTYSTTGGPTADAAGTLPLVACTNATDSVAHSWRFVTPILGTG